MPKKPLSLIESRWLEKMDHFPSAQGSDPEPSPGEWVRLMRTYLRIPQAELAKKAKMTQPHLAAIESDRVDPQWGTLRRIFEAMRMGLRMQPLPSKPLEELLRGRARGVALKRLKQTMGSMSLEKQAPEADKFRELLEKKTDDLLEHRERLRLDND
jgi:transcriptional regulator with XRE-family HTH domain